MGHRPSCRSCRHCTPPAGGLVGWCQLRQLPIHHELVAELWCHHWTGRPPRLPAFGSQADHGDHPDRDGQLSLAVVLPDTREPREI